MEITKKTIFQSPSGMCMVLSSVPQGQPNSDFSWKRSVMSITVSGCMTECAMRPSTAAHTVPAKRVVKSQEKSQGPVMSY